MKADSDHQTRRQTIVVVSGSGIAEQQELSNLIETNGYQSETAVSIEDLLTRSNIRECLALLIDVDSVTVNNRTIRDLKLKFRDTEFLCISGTRFHPDLQEAISHHFYACLLKPVDPDELSYWLKCIGENERSSPVE